MSELLEDIVKLVQETPFAPGTHVGTRQQWVKDAIVAQLRGDPLPPFSDRSRTRPTKDQWLMKVALLTSEMSTCHRRQVGAVLADHKSRVLATGYNGVPAGFAHCRGGESLLCSGREALSGMNLDGCQAIHAEQNALLQCEDADAIFTCYTTASPCLTCVKLLLNTHCRRIVFSEEYPHPTARDLWVTHGKREWVKI